MRPVCDPLKNVRAKLNIINNDMVRITLMLEWGIAIMFTYYFQWDNDFEPQMGQSSVMIRFNNYANTKPIINLYNNGTGNDGLILCLSSSPS